MENFAYKEIKQQNFSDPHPWFLCKILWGKSLVKQFTQVRSPIRPNWADHVIWQCHDTDSG